MFTMEELRKMYPYMSWENMNHLQESVKTINSVLYENILASGIFSYMNTEQKAKLKERVRKIKKDEDETQIKNVQKTTPEPQVASTEGNSKMKDIKEMYRKRVFDELTPVQLDELLLGEIDELNLPIKIGSLEFKASEIIKQLRPDALENDEFLVALFESEEWYEKMMIGLDNEYCWLYPPTDENGEYLKYEGVNPEKDHSFFRWQGCYRILREVEIDFLLEYKNILLQENQNDLLQEVKEKLQNGNPKHDNPIEVEIYSEDKSVRKFLNSNGEESFRAVEKPKPQVVEANVHLEVAKDLEDKKGAKINYGTFFCAASKGDLEVVKYLVELIEKDTPIATWMDSERDDDESSYAVWEAASNGHLEVVKYLVGEKGAYIGISTAFYAGTNGHLEVLKYLVDEKGAKIDDIKDAVKHCTEHGHLEVLKYLVDEKGAAPEPTKPIEVRTGVILQEVTEGCSCEKYSVHEGCVAKEGDTWTDFTEGLKVGEMSVVKDNTGECPKCGTDIRFKEYYIVTNVEFRPNDFTLCV